MNNNIVPLFLVAALFCCAWHFHGANCTLGDKPPAVNINIPSGSKKVGDTSNAASLQDTSSASWPPSTGTIKRWQPRHRQQGGGSRSAASSINAMFLWHNFKLDSLQIHCPHPHHCLQMLAFICTPNIVGQAIQHPVKMGI
jgi:hypothetical protein